FHNLPEKLEDYSALILTDISPALRNKSKNVTEFINSGPKIPILALGESDQFITDKKGKILTVKDLTAFATPEKQRNLLQNFVLEVANLPQNWTPQRFADNAVNKLRDQIGQEHVVLGLSGGVDSTVTAVLLN